MLEVESIWASVDMELRYFANADDERSARVEKAAGCASDTKGANTFYGYPISTDLSMQVEIFEA